MSVKIRLTRMGKKKQPSYRVVVMDSRKPRDGAYLEQIGFYDPRQDPSVIEIDNDRVVASYKRGVLELMLPMASSSKPRQIAVKAG